MVRDIEIIEDAPNSFNNFNAFDDIEDHKESEPVHSEMNGVLNSNGISIADSIHHRHHSSIHLTVFDEGDDALYPLPNGHSNGNQLIAAYASSGHSDASPLSSGGSDGSVAGSPGSRRGSFVATDVATDGDHHHGSSDPSEPTEQTETEEYEDEELGVHLDAEDEILVEEKEESSASIVYMDSDHDSDSEDVDSDDNEIPERNMRYIRRGVSMINIDVARLRTNVQQEVQRRKSYSARFDTVLRNGLFDRSAIVGLDEEKADGQSVNERNGAAPNDNHLDRERHPSV